LAQWLQHSGSFKTRGAFNAMLSRGISAAGVTAASGGKYRARSPMRLGTSMPTISLRSSTGKRRLASNGPYRASSTAALWRGRRRSDCGPNYRRRTEAITGARCGLGCRPARRCRGRFGRRPFARRPASRPLALCPCKAPSRARGAGRGSGDCRGSGSGRPCGSPASLGGATRALSPRCWAARGRLPVRERVGALLWGGQCRFEPIRRPAA